MYQLLLTACYVSESIENDKQMINNSMCFDCLCKKKKKKKKAASRIKYRHNALVWS